MMVRIHIALISLPKFTRPRAHEIQSFSRALFGYVAPLGELACSRGNTAWLPKAVRWLPEPPPYQKPKPPTVHCEIPLQILTFVD